MLEKGHFNLNYLTKKLLFCATTTFNTFCWLQLVIFKDVSHVIGQFNSFHKIFLVKSAVTCLSQPVQDVQSAEWRKS